MFHRILARKEFRDKPPVLIDVGASGTPRGVWKELAKYCICIGFDGDTRATAFGVVEGGDYKKQFVFNKIVSDSVGVTDFYLTASPYCSSTLKPDTAAIQPWFFADLFNVEKKVTAECTDLLTVLKTAGLDYVDWFKTDSQGTDLRIFKCLPRTLLEKVIVAEFEPGLMDAYCGEDKLHAVLAYMESLPFWLAKLFVNGTYRLSSATAAAKLGWLERRFIHLLLPRSPYWAEMTYINSFSDIRPFDLRGLLLGCVFGLLHKQYGFVYELAGQGIKRFGDTDFERLQKYAIRRIKRNSWQIVPYLVKRILEKMVGK